MNKEIEHALQFHKDNGIPISENIFRPHTENYYGLFCAARTLKEDLDLTSFDRHLLSTDIGEFGIYEGEEVPLDHPFIAEAEYKGRKVELDTPKRGGKKKYFVYVKNDKGNVVKVEWGDTTGLTAKINDKAAAASFAARHQCHLKKDRTTPGWWACNMPRYAKDLGLKGGGNFFW
jgi:hypothetical protein